MLAVRLGNGQVTAKLRAADIFLHFVTAFAQGCGQSGAQAVLGQGYGEGLFGAGVEVGEYPLRAWRVACGTGAGELQERAQGCGAIVVGVGDGIGLDAGDNRHAFTRAAEDHVQALFSAALIDRTEVHQHLAVRPWRVADAQDNHVALVTLNVLQVFHEQAIELPGILTHVFTFQAGGEVCVAGGQALQRLFDFALLGLGKRHDTQAQTGFAAQQFAYQTGDVARLGNVATADVHAVLDFQEADRAVEQSVCALNDRLILAGVQRRADWHRVFDTTVRNGDQPPLIKRRIGKADQRLVTAAVVPRQQCGRKIAGRLTQQAVGIKIDGNLLAVFHGDQFVVLLVAGAGEEIGRRQLHFVTDHNHLLRTAQRRHRFFAGDLTGFVENHHVEQVRCEWQGVGH